MIEYAPPLGGFENVNTIEGRRSIIVINKVATNSNQKHCFL